MIERQSRSSVLQVHTGQGSGGAGDSRSLGADLNNTQDGFGRPSKSRLPAVKDCGERKVTLEDTNKVAY